MCVRAGNAIHGWFPAPQFRWAPYSLTSGIIPSTTSHKAVFLLALIALSSGYSLRAAEKTPPRGAQGPAGILGSPRSSLMNINNVSMWATDNGMLERRPDDFTAGVT